MPKCSFLIILVLLVSLTSLYGSNAQAEELLVPSQFPTIQGAIEAAMPLDQILVDSGTYVENLDFLGKSITVTGVNGPDFTVIDGSELTRGPDEGSTIVFASGESPLAILEGFTIRGGTGKSITDATGTHTSNGTPEKRARKLTPSFVSFRLWAAESLILRMILPSLI